MFYDLLAAARGDEKADLLLKNAYIVDVFNEKLLKENLAIKDGFIIGFGDYEALEELDLEGKIIAPGFIDAHLHLESTMLSIPEIARLLIPEGTTTIIADPHEIANVSGLKGIRYFLKEGLNYPWNFKLMLPSCVPATSFETSGAILNSEDLNEIKDEEGIFGLGEVMNYPGVIFGDEEVWKKLRLAKGRFIDGHAPNVTGKDLNAYLLGNIKADHECTSPKEALEKVSKGMAIMIREGSATKDLDNLLPIVDNRNYTRFCFATDDLHAEDILKRGHINYMVKRAIDSGFDRIRAIRLASYNAANILGLENLGALAPGYQADLVVLDNLDDFNVEQVYKDGKLVAENKKALFPIETSTKERAKEIFSSVNLADLSVEDFSLPEAKKYRVIGLLKDKVITKAEVFESSEPLDEKLLLENNLTKIAVVERHKASGNVSLGLLKDYGLKRGALATSVGHDSHNITVAGLKSEDMYLAVEEIKKMQGGLVLVEDGKVIKKMPLEIAGLMSEEGALEVAKNLKEIQNLARERGIKETDPFMTLGFMPLAVIPELKITDQGLFDVNTFSLVDLVIE